MKKILLFGFIAMTAACSKETGTSNPQQNNATVTTNGNGSVITGAGGNNNNCVQASSNIITQSRQTAAFSGVKYQALVGRVIIKKGSQGLSITGPDNILPLIETNVANGLLTVTPKANTCINLQQGQEIVVNITVPDLNKTELAQAVGTIDVQDAFTAASFEANISQGSGIIKAFNLAGTAVKSTLFGTGTVEVTASQTLNATIFGTGNIKYKGNPQITKSIFGTGQVINAN